MKRSKRALPHTPYAHQQIRKWRRALLTSWESEEVWEEALLRITNNLDQHSTPFTSIFTWIGDDCHWKAAICLGLLPKEWASKAQGATAARKRKSKEQGEDKDEDEEPKLGATQDRQSSGASCQPIFSLCRHHPSLISPPMASFSRLSGEQLHPFLAQASPCSPGWGAPPRLCSPLLWRLLRRHFVVLFLLALFLLSSLFVIVSRMPSRRPASIMYVCPPAAPGEALTHARPHRRGCAAAPHQLAHLLADLRPEDLQTHMVTLTSLPPLPPPPSLWSLSGLSGLSLVSLSLSSLVSRLSLVSNNKRIGPTGVS